jgi:hypothetical protein
MSPGLRSFTGRLGLAALLAALLWQPVSGQEPEGGCAGDLSSVVLDEVPRGLPVEVGAFRSGDPGGEFRDAFGMALKELGYGTAPNAPLALELEAEMSSSGTQSYGRSGLIEDQPGRGGREPTERDPSGEDFRLGIRQPRVETFSFGNPANQDVRNSLYVNAMLRDRRTGRVVWTADANCEVLPGSRRGVARAVAMPIVRSIGRSVQRESF